MQSDDQGLVNTDPRTIAVPDTFINNIPTDVRGLSFSRTPQQLINMYSLGNPDGTGPFFPYGLVGAITTPTGYTDMATGLEDFPSEPYLATQVQAAPHLKFQSHATPHAIWRCLCWIAMYQFVFCVAYSKAAQLCLDLSVDGYMVLAAHTSCWLEVTFY